MKRFKSLNKVVFIVVVFIGLFSLLGCGQKNNSGNNEKKQISENSVRTVKIGIGNDYNPFCYVSQDGKLTGYEYEVLKKIDDKLPQYEFSYEPTEFANILVGLDTGNYDMGVHGFSWNEERNEKYLYSEVPSVTTGGYVIIGAKGKDFKTLKDLARKKVQVKTGGNVSTLLEEYNKNNPNNLVNIVYEDSENEQIVSNIVNGVYDAYINEKIDADQWVKQFDGIEEYGESIFGDQENSGCYYLYTKKDTQLERDISKVLKELQESGETGKISKEFLGEDYTK